MVFAASPRDFKVHAVAHDYDAVEGQPRVEHRQFAMIQIWKPKHSATVIRLDSVFAHGDGLPSRRIGTTAQTVGQMQALGHG